jgi:hypothetical protein
LKFVDPSGMLKKLISNIIKYEKEAVIDIWNFSGLNATMFIWYTTKLNPFEKWKLSWDLGVSAQMLKTFMYENGEFQIYWEWDIIYNKVKETKFYKQQINLARQKTLENENGWYSNGSTLFTERDLYYSIKKADWGISASINTKWEIETVFSLDDTYNFDEWDYLEDLWSTLNAMWLRYQDRWYWRPYKWNLTIIETY